ncbi:hypothetical protein [Thermostaphylospora chromogena]|uniref:Mce-associated membrane protein n=1 Tax=Thermostaphylospora chromogena TaxID=35622 RepID=A0A1H1B4A7_9ACTN|nr:hypothetical protein [Thermostaphylospora chromogena]SDQ46276.1 hypothetical protein SAMN04489764_0774 [Thermostaphylospora chromogena]
MSGGFGDRRGLVFAGVVAVLAAVGLYLTLGPRGGGGASGVAERPENGREASTWSPRPSPTSVATASDAPFDIYSFLPMTERELSAAADVAKRFTASYGTYRHDEDPSSYAERLRGFTTTELGEVLTRAVTDPVAVEQNRADELVSVGSAEIDQIRRIEETSVTFTVTCTQEITSKGGSERRVEEYAVTLVRVGADWRVYDLQPADEGQEGDPSPGPEGAA